MIFPSSPWQLFEQILFAPITLCVFPEKRISRDRKACFQQPARPVAETDADFRGSG
jgi:hypothetical protein